jgi:hypothetical protein
VAQVYADITKIDKKQHIVEGYATTSSVDRDNQAMDEEFLKREFPKWADKYGNIRYMHKPTVVGKVIHRSDWDGKGFYITAKISDPRTWEQIENGELNGFSIGVKNAKIEPDPIAPGGRITDGEIIETSVVDIPSNRDSDFVLRKFASFDEEQGSWVDDMEDIMCAALRDDIAESDIDAYKRYYSQKERKEMPESDFAGPHRSFPIKTQEDVDNAARLIGHAKNPEQVKRRIIEIARRKGFKIPESWQKEEDAKKDVTLDSGLQGTNLEGEKEDKKIVADEMKTTEAVETEVAEAEVEKSAETVEAAEEVEKAAIAPELTQQLFNALQEISAKLEALASQTDKDKDGDIDTEGELETDDHVEPKPASDFEDAVEGKTVEAEEAKTVELTEEQRELVKSLVAEEVARILSEQADTTKSMVADETKSLVADVEKRFDELHKTVTDLAEKVEQIGQMAAPAKGSVMEREVQKTASSPEDLMGVLSKLAAASPEEAQKQAFAEIYKSSVLGGQK